MTTVILQEPKHCQIVSSVQDTKSCCVGATLGSTNISSRWSCQAPFFSLEMIQFYLYILLLPETFLCLMIFFCNKVKGVHIIRRVQQAKKKARSAFTIYGRLMNISQRVPEWQVPINCLQLQQNPSSLLKHNTQGTRWEISIYTSGETSMWSFILAFDLMWALEPYRRATYLNIFLFIAFFEMSKLFTNSYWM